jgi:hypothetical protein
MPAAKIPMQRRVRQSRPQLNACRYMTR